MIRSMFSQSKLKFLLVVGFLSSAAAFARGEPYGDFFCRAPLSSGETSGYMAVEGSYSYRGGFAGMPIFVSVGDAVNTRFQQASGGVSVLGSVEASATKSDERLHLRYFGPYSTMNKIEVGYLTTTGWVNIIRKEVSCQFAD